MAAVIAEQPCIIKLSGSLGRACGRTHKKFLDSGTVKEVFSALKNSVPGFEKFIKRAEKKGLQYAIFRNRKNVGTEEFELGGTREVRIVPIIQGAKRGGVLQTIVGAAMIVTGVLITPYFPTIGATLVSAGIANVAGGVYQMISPQTNGLKTRDSPENQPSYAFGGAVNTTAAGNPVPLLYGKRRIGGAIISAGIHTEDVSA